MPDAHALSARQGGEARQEPPPGGIAVDPVPGRTATRTNLAQPAHKTAHPAEGLVVDASHAVLVQAMVLHGHHTLLADEDGLLAPP
eukprot:11414244-Alexandrium_andersonii.AAC.1